MALAGAIRAKLAPQMNGARSKPHCSGIHQIFLWKWQKYSKHMQKLHVDPPQNTTLLLPPTSTGFYPDGIPEENTMGNSGKFNLKMGFKSPSEQKCSPISCCF
jgi:hypothetical protein